MAITIVIHPILEAVVEAAVAEVQAVANILRNLFLLLICLSGLQLQAVQKTDTTAVKKAPLIPVEKQFNWSKVHEIPTLIQQGKLQASHIPDPHWRDDACLACHHKAGKQASSRNLRQKNKDGLCLNCHDARYDHSYIHPVEIKQPASIKGKYARQFNKALSSTGGKITCTTCHDLSMQCLSEKRKQKDFNPRFFRGGPFETRSEQCFICHESAQYQRVNPHEQIDDKGNIRDKSCRVCHAGSVEELKQAESDEKIEYNATSNLEKMCWGCHPWKPHPGGQFSFFSSQKGPNHLREPSKRVLDRLAKKSKEQNIYLPLEPGTGRVYCATCHNPHEKGVIKNPAAAIGADSKRRLRDQKICQFCHDK